MTLKQNVPELKILNKEEISIPISWIGGLIKHAERFETDLNDLKYPIMFPSLHSLLGYISSAREFIPKK